METRTSIGYNCTKTVGNYRYDIKVRLHDDLKNGYCHFAITYDLYEKKRNHRWYEVGCGSLCSGDESKAPANLAPFLKLHCCDSKGCPDYPVANGSYYMRVDKPDDAKRYLRITDNEYAVLKPVADAKDDLYFKYMLKKLGIADRWKKEAEEFIAFIESKMNVGDIQYKWEDPYKDSEQSYRSIDLLPDEIAQVESKIASGYYTDEAIAKRNDEARNAFIKKKMDEALEDLVKAKEEANVRYDIAMLFLKNGFTSKNYIYYPHKKLVVVNWKYGHSDDKFTEEQFKTLIDSKYRPFGIDLKFGE